MALRVLVGIDAKVAELAALAAKRNVDVQAQRNVGVRLALERLGNLSDFLAAPQRVRGIIRDKVAADFGGGGGVCCHRVQSIMLRRLSTISA